MLIGTASFFGFITISKVTLYIAIVLIYKRVYFNAVDTIIACIKERFDLPAFKNYKSLEFLVAFAKMTCVLKLVLFKLHSAPIREARMTFFCLIF